MEHMYPLRSLTHLQARESCTVVGKVTGTGPDFVILSEGDATVKVMNLPQGVVGWIEVRGVANAGVVVAEDFTRIKSDVEVETYRKIVQVYEHAPITA